METRNNAFARRMQKRRENDKKALEDAYAQINGAVVGKTLADALGGSDEAAESAIAQILTFYHFKPVNIPDEVTGVEDRLDYALKPAGIMRRNVELTPGWSNDAIGAFLAVRKDTKDVVACIPRRGGYFFHDTVAGKNVRITRRNESLFERDALCFYEPLPQGRLSLSKLITYFAHTISPFTAICVAACSLVATLFAALTPALIAVLMGPVIQSENSALYISVAVFLVASTVSATLISAMQTLLKNRLSQQGLVAVQSAMVMRTLNLPVSFFREYGAGDLAFRLQAINDIWETVTSVAFGAGLTAIMSLVYVVQLFVLGRGLVLPAMLVIAVVFVVTLAMVVRGGSYQKETAEISAQQSRLQLEMLSGVQKVKLSGSEHRAFGKWATAFSELLRVRFNRPFIVKYGRALVGLASAIGTIILYSCAVSDGLSVATFFAFMASYGLATGSFVSLAGLASSITQAHASLDMLNPFLEAEPEAEEGRYALTELNGGVELSHVAFRYSEHSPYVFRDLNLKIHPGEYVAIVGKSGCGKSTLIRLLLGFERAERGAVLYDGHDIACLDVSALRQSIGVVMQNAQMLHGDVYSNIVISRPQATLEEAWEAAEAACIADDIRAMPMGMRTLVVNGSGGISGGQRQRLAIARAIVGKPKILLFDEATSALDNNTQRKVSEALDKMGCTRIVIAHRLSTIKQCDRVVVIDQGSIVADGAYEEVYADHLS